MEQGTKQNAIAWSEVYQKTEFGNKYPTDGLVSLYHHFIKKELTGIEGPIKVLDFACSHGANAKFFSDLGFDVYGIDISDNAIEFCICKQGFEREKFIAYDVLKGKQTIKDLFGKFHLVVASECLYYFSLRDLQRLLQVFSECMYDNAVFYGNMHTWNHPLYREYRRTGMDAEGLVRIPASGTAELPLGVHIVENKGELRNLFGVFQEIAVVRSILELESESETLHFIGKKI